MAPTSPASSRASPPQGELWCGSSTLCQVATQLCWGVPGEGQFTCQPLPEACLDNPPVTCDCIEANEPGHGCTGNATDGFTVVIFEK